MSRNVIGAPARPARLATTTFADAPTIVALPPRQAPSASAHHSGSIGMPLAPSSCTTGIIVAVYGMLSMIAEAMPLNHSSPRVVTVGSPPVSSIRQSATASTMPTWTIAVDEHEQADEEEERRPLDLARTGLGVEAGRAGSGRPPRAGRSRRPRGRAASEQEAERRSAPMTARLRPQQAEIGDDLAFVEREDAPRARRRGRRGRAAKEPADHDQEPTKMIAATGAMCTRKSSNPSPAADPMRMFGGSPISVAVPPMLRRQDLG